MKTIQTKLKKEIKKSVSTDIGDFYFFENVIISEIKNGATLSWDSAQNIIQQAREFYGHEAKVSYISNRINNYSVRPNDWVKLASVKENNISCFSIVYKSDDNWTTKLLENFISNTEINKFNDLVEAYGFCKQKHKTVLDKKLNKAS